MPKQPKEKDQVAARNGWKASSLLWGGLIILLGVLLLIGNLGLVVLEWTALLQLWPVLIVIGGVSLLPLRGIAAWVVYGVTAIGVGALVWAALTATIGAESSGTTTENFNIGRAHRDIENLDVAIDASGGSLNINSHSGNNMLTGSIDSRLNALKYETTTDDGTQRVKFPQERDWNWLAPRSINNLNININRDIPTSLDIDAGAISIRADLSDVLLSSVKVDSGASKVDLKLGNRLDQSNVEIDTGASSVDISIPKDSAVRLRIDSGVSSKDIPQNLQKIDDDTYQTADYDSSTKRINMTISMGVSSFKLRTH